MGQGEGLLDLMFCKYEIFDEYCLMLQWGIYTCLPPFVISILECNDFYCHALKMSLPIANTREIGRGRWERSISFILGAFLQIVGIVSAGFGEQQGDTQNGVVVFEGIKAMVGINSPHFPRYNTLLVFELEG